MGIHAYNELYLNNARNTLGTMLDYAVNFMDENIDMFFAKFITSGIADNFGFGNPTFITGKTGVDLFLDVQRMYGQTYNYIAPYMTTNRSPEYWTGHYLAYAQWFLNVAFRDITFAVPISEIRSWYYTDHETDVMRFTDKIWNRILKANDNLKLIRNRMGLSQSELANLSGVNIRNIQLFEQGKNDISKAQYNTLNSLARTLNCREQDFVQTIDLKQRFLNNLKKINEEYLTKLNSIRQESEFQKQRIMQNYINQFPYNNVAYLKNDYYVDYNQYKQNAQNYWQNYAIKEQKQEEYQKNIQQIADLLAEASGDKTIKITNDAIALVNSKSILEAAYRILQIIDEATKK